MTPEKRRNLILLGLFGFGCYQLGKRAGVRSVDPVALLESISLSKTIFLETPIGDLMVMRVPDAVTS